MFVECINIAEVTKITGQINQNPLKDITKIPIVNEMEMRKAEG